MPLALFLILFFVSTARTPPPSPLFPYTTLFRSAAAARVGLRDTLRPSHDRRGGRRRGHRREVHGRGRHRDRKSTRLNSSHVEISYAVFCLKKKKESETRGTAATRRPGTSGWGDI